MSDWIEFRGADNEDDCPVSKASVVDVVLADGYELLSCTAGNLRWVHDNSSGDIIRYRVIMHSQEPDKESTTPPKDTMKIYCDNFLALTKALENAGGNAAGLLMRSHEFLETLARNRIEIDAKYLGEGV